MVLKPAVFKKTLEQIFETNNSWEEALLIKQVLRTTEHNPNTTIMDYQDPWKYSLRNKIK